MVQVVRQLLQQLRRHLVIPCRPTTSAATKSSVDTKLVFYKSTVGTESVLTQNQSWRMVSNCALSTSGCVRAYVHAARTRVRVDDVG